MFYWFYFEDGYRECCRGYDRIEMVNMVAKHGRLIRKEVA